MHKKELIISKYLEQSLKFCITFIYISDINLDAINYKQR